MTVIVKELLARFKGDTKGLEQAGSRAKRAIDGIEKKTKQVGVEVQQSFSGMSRAVNVLVSATAGLKVAQLADQYALLRARIEQSTRTTEEFTEAFDGLKDISKETGADFGATVSVFQRISFVRDELNATTSEMLQFTETVSKLGVVSGASTGALRAGLTQLGQSLSSNVVRAEEFNSIMENIPAVGTAIAEVLGVTTGELRQLVIEGEVLSEDVFKAILLQSEKTRLEFEKFPKTVGQAMNRLRIGIMEASGEIANATGATRLLIAAMEGVGRAIEAVTEIVKAAASIIAAFWDLVVAGIIDAFNIGTRFLQNRINGIIDTMNLLRSEAEQIQRLDFAPETSRRELAQNALQNATKDLEGAKQALLRAWEAVQPQYEEVGEEIANVDQQIEELTEKYNTKLENMKDDEKQSKKSSKEETRGIREATRAIQEQQEEIRKTRDEMADLFADGITGWNDLRDVAVNALQEIAKATLRQAIGGTSRGGFFGSIATSILGSFGLGGTTTPNPTIFGPPRKPSFNSGGSFMVRGTSGIDRNTLSLNGQPISNVSKGEKVSIGQGSEGVMVNQTINVETGVSQTVRAEMVRLLPAIQASTVDAVKESRLRGKT